MELLNCVHCDKSTFHQTSNMLGTQIHREGSRCMRCGGFRLFNSRAELMAVQHELDELERRLSHGG